MSKERLIEVPAGPHGQDGVELELFTRHFIAMRLRGQAERAKTTLLTKEQATRLRDALDELIQSLDDDATEASSDAHAGGPTKLKAA